MRSMTLLLSAAAVALCAGAVAAESHPRHVVRHRVAPAVATPAYDAYGPSRARAEEFSGTSVPYDPDGPGYNDFQLQGTD